AGESVRKAVQETEDWARDAERGAQSGATAEEDSGPAVWPAAPAGKPVAGPPPEPRGARGAAKPRSKDKARGHERGNAGGRGRSLKGELHLSDAERARRSRGKKSRRPEPSRGSSSGPHGFSKPTAPVVSAVAVG